MPLSCNEIKSRALCFSKEWANESSEKAEAKSFWDGFFYIFGITRRRIASFEEPVKKTDGKGGYIDLLWKGTLLVEHKSRGKNLDTAFEQAKEYFPGLKERDLPRYIIVSDFAKFRLYDLDARKQHEFTLLDLYNNVHLFNFVAGYKTHTVKPQDPVNIKAAEHLGLLHDQLKEFGYTGHELEVYLVRLLFCLFSEDTGIFERGQFQNYIENRTAEDGSDLAYHITTLFQVLNTPEHERLKNLDEQISDFPYIDGKLFEETLSTAAFNSKMRQSLLDCCCLDWSLISPAIFGSLFQSVMNKDLRRELGAHYTTEQNILKVIHPLFLDDLLKELKRIKNNKGKLEEFHRRLALMKFFDPACGCGNFLVIAYRELRLLELKILSEIYKKEESSMFLDISTIVLLDVDQFYGIEIEEFPSQIAQVALWMMDHQMNILVSKEFGKYFKRLPLKKSPNIIYGNALQKDWNTFVRPNKYTYILSNPPFVGKQYQSSEQRADMEKIFSSTKGAGILDYVSAWYIRAAQIMLLEPQIRAAFVSTNSITQGEQVAVLWNELISKYSIHIHFAHRTFKWGSDVHRHKAAVHCVVIGFASFDSSRKIIFDYEGQRSEPHEINVKNINPYLVDAPNIFLFNRSSPICNVPKIVFGNMPNDGGNLLLTDEEKINLIKNEPESKKWIRSFMGAEEFINGKKKWCLWLENIRPHDLRSLPNISKRVGAVKKHRIQSNRETTKKLADYPTLFGERRQPTANYILIPRVSSEKRIYIPIGFFSSEVIVGDTNLCIPNATIYHFGILTSLMHMAWVRATCGRLKSDYRYSNSLVYNNYPWPEPTEKQSDTIKIAAQNILDVRKKFSDCNLADLYDPISMPPELIKAHQILDLAVDKSYGRVNFKNEYERVEFLFKKYLSYITVSEKPEIILAKMETQAKSSSLDKKLILSSLIVDILSKSKQFGRTKFSKVFYVTDMLCKHDLKTQYYREAAGPVDYNLLYGKKNKIDDIAAEKNYFTTRFSGKRVYYMPGKNIHEAIENANSIFSDDIVNIRRIIFVFKKLTLEQSEIVATLFACWNDRIISKSEVMDDVIIDDVRNNWHVNKKRFTYDRLCKALEWMKKHSILPVGKNVHTIAKKLKK